MRSGAAGRAAIRQDLQYSELAHLFDATVPGLWGHDVQTVRNRSRGRGRLLMLVLGCAAFGILLGAVTWVLLRRHPEWAVNDALPLAVAVAGIGVTLVTAFAGPLFVEWLADRRRGPSLPGLPRGQLEEWRSLLRTGVLTRWVREGSQLAQIMRQIPALDFEVKDRVELAEGDNGRPRLHIGGHSVALSEIARRWSECPSRLVILGEPGYGKTVAALGVLRHVNGDQDKPGKPVAELFALAEWQQWHATHVDAGFG